MKNIKCSIHFHRFVNQDSVVKVMNIAQVKNIIEFFGGKTNDHFDSIFSFILSIETTEFTTIYYTK